MNCKISRSDVNKNLKEHNLVSDMSVTRVENAKHVGEATESVSARGRFGRVLKAKVRMERCT